MKSLEYRIPSIDEFIEGFEFEVYSEGYYDDGIEDFCGWYTYIVGGNNWRDLDQIQEEIKRGNIRVRVK